MNLQRSAFYLLSGLAFATAGAYLGIYASISLQWLILLAAVHALAFGLLGLVIALRSNCHGWNRRVVFLFGAASVVFSGALAGLAKQLENRDATRLLGVYFCFVGVKLFFLAWNLYRGMTTEEAMSDLETDHVVPFALPSSPSAVKR
jgi:energy-converting hydrogenase Eha subunit E